MDPITDMLNRIRNAQALGKPDVVIPFSKIKHDLASVLEKEGFIGKAEKKGKGLIKKKIEISLKYGQDKAPAISGLKKVSKPGQRIYINWRDIRQVRGGYGIAIISTSKGLMTNKEARKRKIGGELICQVW